MRILLSAYACEPNQGSEPGVGWNWTSALARRGHDVYVLTRPEGMTAINEALALAPMPNVKFVYVDPPATAGLLGEIGHRLDYVIWQKRALKAAQRLLLSTEIDVVHHVTMSSLQLGSFLGRLGKPFVFGPIGGGQTPPRGFARYFVGGRIFEFMRTIFVRYLTRHTLFAQSTVRDATIVLCANQITMRLAQGLGARQTGFMPTAALEEKYVVSSAGREQSPGRPFKVLWVSRLLPRKGVLLALEGLSRVDPGLSYSCTFIGYGRLADKLQGWVEKLGLANKIKLTSRVSWHELLEIYAEHDVFLFSTLRDTDGMQIFESLGRGCPIIMLDHDGPRDAAPDDAAIKVPANTPETAASGMARAIERLAADPELLRDMRRNAVSYARNNTWDKRGEEVEEWYKVAVRAHALNSGGAGERQRAKRGVFLNVYRQPKSP